MNEKDDRAGKINYFPGFDARDGLGYGVLKPTGFHDPRGMSQYAEPPPDDPEAEKSIDDDTYDNVLTRLLRYFPADSFPVNNDPFHFVDGATKLGELSTSRGMVPFPRMYADKQAVAGGAAPRDIPLGPTAAFRTRIHPTGTTRGFSQAPYPNGSLNDTEENEYSLENILSKDEDDHHLQQIRDLVSLIHQEQEKETKE